MSNKNRRDDRRKKARVKTGGLIAAAIVTVAALGIFVWLAVDKFGVSGSSDSVELKKSTTSYSRTLQTDSSSAADSTTATEQTTTASTETTMAAKTAPMKVKVSDEVILTETSINIKWEKAEGADGYDVYRLCSELYEGSAPEDAKMTENVGFDWQLIKNIPGADNTSFEDTYIFSGMKYVYKVAAYAMDGDKKLIGAESNTVSKETEPERAANLVSLYDVPKGTQVFNCVGEKLVLANTLYEQGYYTGLPSEAFAGYIAIDYMFETRFVKSESVKMVKDATAVPTSVIGQEGGKIDGSSACGPTAASVIVRYDKGDVWDKDELIVFTEKNKLADQGSMMGEVGKGGMSAPMVIKLIEMYSEGKYSAKNIFTESEKTSEILKRTIDRGKHSILSVRYAWGIVHHPYSIIHFVEPSAYSYENGKMYFYYGDTAFGNGPKGLKKVSAEELDTSVSTVEGEPKCIIVLD